MKQLLQQYSQVFVTGSLGAKSPEMLRSRRKLLAETIKHPIIILGLQNNPSKELPYFMREPGVFQDPCFLYLTGINQSGFALFLYKNEEVLFAPSKDSKHLFWEGEHLGLDHAHGEHQLTSLTGVQRCLPYDSLKEFFEKSFKKTKVVYSHFHEYGLSGRVKKFPSFAKNHEKELKKYCKGLSIDWKCLSETQLLLRLPLDKYRIKDVEKSQAITGQGFINLVQNLKNFKTELDASKFLEYQIRSPQGLSFPTICASGKNACTLHYTKNDALLNGMLLLDFGCRVGTQHADISRTIPVNGIFNPLQALLYDIVLTSQKRVEKAVKPGVTIKKLNEICWDSIESQLQERFISIGGNLVRPYDIRPHGVSHLIGEEEHDGDPFGYYREKPLAKGMFLSNEPGLYGFFTLKIGNKNYKEHIGIRIEDNLLVTAKGCKNMSASIPKEIVDLQKLRK